MLAPVRAPRAVDLATDQLRGEILSGRFAVGSRLPPERELAETLGINRQTLRSAIGRLEGEGLLLPRQGSGITVLDWRRSGGIGLLPHLLDAGRMDLLGPFLAVRRAVAAEALATACRTATDAEIDALQVFAEQLSVESDASALADGNLEFSRRVLRLAGNLPAELLFNTVASLYETRDDLRSVLLSEPDAVRASFPAIVALLRARDPERARAVVQQVLAAIDQATLERLESKP